MAKKHIVKCKFCEEYFDANIIPFIKIGNRYAHENCQLQKEQQKTKEEKDKEMLEQYILKLFNEEFINPRTQKMIKTFVQDYKYTYSGILKSLTYFYEIKQNSVEKANKSIGIVPYVYDKAYRYYYDLWLAQQKNEEKHIETYKPTEKIINIERPERNIKKRKLFTFLDEMEE